MFKKTEQVLSIGNNAFILGFYVYLIKYFIIPEPQELLVASLVHVSTQIRHLSLTEDFISLLELFALVHGINFNFSVLIVPITKKLCI